MADPSTSLGQKPVLRKQDCAQGFWRVKAVRVKISCVTVPIWAFVSCRRRVVARRGISNGMRIDELAILGFFLRSRKSSCNLINKLKLECERRERKSWG